MIDLNKLLQFWKAFRDPDTPLGDMAILKAEAFGVEIPPGIQKRLEPVRSFFPPLHRDTLRTLPTGTLGREVVRQLDDNGFQPFTVSENLRPRVLDHTYLVRYMISHDFIHVLTGFDTTDAGEIGVLAFTVAQGFAPKGAVQEAVARVVYPLRSPRQIKAIRHNRKLGHELGRNATFLLNIRFEDLFEERVVDLRKQFNIPEPAHSGIMPGIPGSRLPGTLTAADLAT